MVQPELNRQARDALNSALDELVDEFTVTETDTQFGLSNYYACSRFFKVLTRHEPWHSHLTSFDVLQIIGHCTAAVLSREKITTTGSLVRLITASAASGLKKDIRDYLFSLPREYEFYCELPSMPKWGPGECQLAENVSLVETAPEDPIATSLAALARDDRFKPNSVYLKIRSSGFSMGMADSTAVAHAVSQLKQFFFAAAQLEIISYRYSFASDLLLVGVPAEAQCRIIDTEDPTSVSPITLADALRRYLIGVTVDEEKLEVWRGNENLAGTSRVATILGGTYRTARTRAEKVEALQSKHASVTTLLDCSEELPDSARVKTALEWAFDSERSDNQTMAILQACMGIEALLGDDDQDEPLTTRLADRCAYLLGKGSQERDVLRKQFKEIYKVRSKLIHGRKARLSVHEQDLLYAAREMLVKVIQVESTNLLKALDREDADAK